MASSKAIRVALLCGCYIIVSSLLIRFNKFLIQPHRFPYPLALATLHMGGSLLLCSLLYVVRPSAFTDMASTEGRRQEVLKWFVPIGITFAFSLYSSNRAYFYCTVTFLQFMKESNVIIIFLISCSVGLQVMNRVKLAVVVWIAASATLCVGSEINFVFVGFVTQLVSQLAECTRCVLGEFVLCESGLKLDPLTYTMFAAPTCLAILFVGNLFSWSHEVVLDGLLLWRILIPNMFLAFLLNVLVAAVIKEISAVGFVLTGLIKDISLVVVSAVFFGEVVTCHQVIGFCLIVIGIMFWSLMKVMPDHPAVLRIECITGLTRTDELIPIAVKKSIV